MKNRVDGHSSLYKDTDSGVIVNREDSDRSRYQTAKRQAHQNMESQRELSEVREELNDIKEMLRMIMDSPYSSVINNKKGYSRRND